MSKNRLDFTANLGRHSHDVSQGFTSSLTTGAIVPQYFDILQPGEKIFYKTHMFCRFKDIPRPFLGEVSLHLDYFFVPAQMLYTLFGQVFAQTDDVISDFYLNISHTNIDQFPIVDINGFFRDNYSYMSSTASPYTDADSLIHGSFRLLDSLGYNPLSVESAYYEDETTPVGNKLPHANFVGFPFALAAYQAIYQKYFRNEEIEHFDINGFNFDTCSLTSDKTLNETQTRKLLTLRFSGRPNDYFTNVRFSPIATSINALGSSSSSNIDGGLATNFGELVHKVSNFLGASSSYGPQLNDSGLSDEPAILNSFGSIYSMSVNAEPDSTILSAQNIRAVFALDKYMRVYGRAGRTYDDQILAHFGVKIPHDVKHELTHLKHYRIVLQSDPVISTADTEHGAVGMVGGQLAAQFDSSNEESFVAPVHGVFMCVAHVVTHPRYYLCNDKLNAISERLQLPIAEFDKLGAQPILRREFGHDSLAFSGLWKNRYSEFKEKYNRCSVTFAHDITDSYSANFYSPWVVSRKPFTEIVHNPTGTVVTTNLPEFNSFFESPCALDNVMSQVYNGAWSTDYRLSPHMALQSDPILTEFACFAKKVSWMSPTGEPDL